jgi:UDP-N-acetylglucosamine 3-dehydrogenase
MLKVGLIGLGMMGTNHARVLNSLDQVQLTAVVDPLREDVNLGRDVSIFQSMDDLNTLDLDYCVIAAPTIHHEQIALKLIDRGIPFLIEKPLSNNLNSAMKITSAAKKNKVKVGVGHIERYNSALQVAKNKISEGVLGTIYQISTRRQGFFPKRISDVGVVFDLATHDIDLTSWLVDSKYKNISANSASRSGREHEDLISISGNLEGNIVVNHIVNWLSPLKERNIQIIGENGVFVIDTLLSDLTYFENGANYLANSQVAFFKGVSQGQVVKYAFDKHEPLRAEHEAFRDAILGEESNIVTLESAVETIRVAEAVLESAENNRNIQL